ncbi:hypothetical protein M9Y10_011096 [Tritrichomonas musculus]|uniref:Uncharacterized protein n=1 Tax=Tritrichomonas musculus TaxID=1915356 RepID=A0ABR2IMI5_9EUKA
MLNSTFIALNIISLMSTSPFYAIQLKQHRINTGFFKSHFQRSLSNIFYSASTNHFTVLSNVLISHTLSNAINFNSEQQCFLHEGYIYQPNAPIGGQTINNTQSYFKGDCGNVTITGCTFIDCSSKTRGGAICIEQECCVIIHNTIFNSCSTSENAGGACFIAKKFSTGPPNFNDEQLQEMDIQYCCFQNLKGNPQLYGIAIFSAAKKTILYYASTVNCPGQNSVQVRGAQFDLQAQNASSQDVNATDSNAYYCGGIEYRWVTEGFFRFQTISKMKCMYSVAYSDIKTKNLLLFDSNIQEITLHRSNIDPGDPKYSGLIHVRYTSSHATDSIVITGFCFMNNKFNDNDDDFSRIISRGTKGGKVSPYPVTLIDCYYDCGNDRVAFNTGKIETLNCVANTVTFNDIPQLNLGECKGEVTAAPLTPSPSYFFTNSMEFSNSKEFSSTKKFSESRGFSDSKEFSSTKKFSESRGFSDSKEFSSSKVFTGTKKFSNSKKFTDSKVFSNSNAFTNSNVFSNSNAFTNSNVFSNSNAFTNSNVFSNSNAFTNSNVFSNSNDFTKSSLFASSDPFSSSHVFSSSKEFSSSNEFTKSFEFTNSAVFIPKENIQKSNKTAMIAGIAAGVGAAAIAAAIVAFFLIKKHPKPEIGDLETIEDSQSALNRDNPLYDKNAEDDPFKDDFIQ